MSRYHVIAALVLVAVVAALGLTYKFYFEEKLQAYTQAEEDREKLINKLEQVQKRFKGQQPDDYFKAMNDAIAPLNDAVLVRSQFFNLRDFWVEEQIPEDVRVPMKFHYQRQYREKEAALQQDAYAHIPPVAYPFDLFTRSFGAPAPEQLADASVSREDVQRWLTQINYGMAVTRLLIKANALAINDIVLWPPRDEFGVLEMRTVGLSFQIRAEDLVAFLEALQGEDRYFNVNALRIRNSNLLWPNAAGYGSPPLEVEMLLTLSRYDETKAGAATGPGALAAAGGGGVPNLASSLGLSFGGARQDDEVADDRMVRKKSWWQKLWPF